MKKDFCTTYTNFNYFISVGFHNSKECKAGYKRVGKTTMVCVDRTDQLLKKYFIRQYFRQLFELV